jgi:YVTN family beta-propeller protein
LKISTIAVLLLVLANWSATAQTVVATIKVGSAPALLAVDRVNNLIYVTNAGDSTVSVIDGATNTVIATPAVGSYPQAITVNSTLRRIYVGNFGAAEQLSVIAGRSNYVQQIRISKAPVITGLGVNSSNASVYMCNGGRKVVVLNGHTNTVKATVTVPNCGFGLNVNPRTYQVYVATFTPNVTVIDSQTDQIDAIFPIDLSGVVTVAVDPHSNRLGLVDTNAGELEVLDAANGNVLGTVTGLSRPFGAVFAPGGHTALVTEESGNDLALIDTDNFNVVSRTTVGNFPLGLDLNPSTHLAYVVNTNDNTVSVVSIP